MTKSAKKPSYLGTLNAIANGERVGAEIFSQWAKNTKDKNAKRALQTVGLREAEHALAFEKRMCELGFDLQLRPVDNLKKASKIVTSKKSDIEKFKAMGVKKPQSKNRSKNKSKNDNADDPLLRVLADTSIDAQTGALLGRFICEERDSAQLLSNAFKKLLKKQAH